MSNECFTKYEFRRKTVPSYLSSDRMTTTWPQKHRNVKCSFTFLEPCRLVRANFSPRRTAEDNQNTFPVEVINTVKRKFLNPYPKKLRTSDADSGCLASVTASTFVWVCPIPFTDSRCHINSRLDIYSLLFSLFNVKPLSWILSLRPFGVAPHLPRLSFHVLWCHHEFCLRLHSYLELVASLADTFRGLNWPQTSIAYSWRVRCG